MAYGKSNSFKKRGGDDKYLRLTGMWQAKSNDDLYSGKVIDLDPLKGKLKEALENGSPLIFSIWVNSKKKSKRDPEFSLQVFVGDSEEKPKSRGGYTSGYTSGYSSDEQDEDRPRNKKRVEEDEPEEAEEEESEEESEEEEQPKRKRTGKPEPTGKKKSTSKDDDW